jgi:predicted AAA+ superfamily ATPase
LLRCPDRSFFLFGPRATGKTTWSKQVVPDALNLDLLDTSLYLELTRNPYRLQELVGNRPSGSWIVLDEIQKFPALLDEVHWLMESRRLKFALCGSSGRELRLGGANLLAARATR